MGIFLPWFAGSLSSFRHSRQQHPSPAVRHHMSSQWNSLKIVQILSRRSTPASTNQFHFIFTISHVLRACRVLHGLGRGCSCCTLLNYYNSLRATVFVRIFMLTIHRSMNSVPRTNRSRYRSVYQHVSFILLSGCIRTASSLTQQMTEVLWATISLHHVIIISCSSHCFVLAPISSCTQPSSGTSVYLSTRTY